MSLASRESAALEYRAQSAIVTDVTRIVGGIRGDVADAHSTSQAVATLERRAARVRRDPDPTLRGTLADAMLAADLVGRWHALRGVIPDTFALLSPSSPSSWTSPRVAQRALDYLTAKDLMSPAQFAALRDGYRSAGFSIAGVTESDALAVALRSVRLSLRRAYSVEQAAQALNDALARAGYARLRPWHARLVAQMNYASAYGAGSYEALHARGLRGIIPAYRYVTMEDERVRPEHAVMDGFVAARNHPIWAVWWPPNGYNCRCRIVGVNAAEWELRDRTSDPWPRFEWTDQDGVVHERAARPDKIASGKSFAGNPSRYVRARIKEGRAR